MSAFSSSSFSPLSFGGFDFGASEPETGGALSPLAVAVQGIGFGALLVAVQGFYGSGGGETSSIHYETRGFMVNMGTFMGRM
jgi:hypothetical protein